MRARRRPLARVAVLNLVGIVLLGACGSSQRAATSGKVPSTLPMSISIATSTPAQAVVTAYYDALSRHQFTVSDGYLAPSSRGLQDTNIDSPNNNLVSLTGLTISSSQTVSASFLPGLPAGVSPSDYDAFAQVTAEYNATFKRVITAHDGPQTQFLYLGRLHQDGRWQILSIGSGP